jgi:hypothetical protein
MADENKKPKNSFAKSLVWKMLKATIKGIIYYVLYLLVWSFIAPLAAMVPELQTMVEAFMTVFIVLMIFGELTSGTIYQHFFNAARALFVMGYMIVSLQGGILGFNFENVSLMIDIRFFIVFALLLSLVGLAKTVLQAINYMYEKSEPYPKLV